MEDALTQEMMGQATEQDQIATLRKLEVLFNRIPKLENLQFCYNLQELDLVETGPLESLSGIESISHSLEILRLNRCGITHIDSQMTSLKNLRELYMPNNEIEIIENLEGCPQLEKLWLTSNKIRRLENLESNSFLKELVAQDNQISKLENLRTLVNLQNLNITQNPISTFNDIKEIAYLAVLQGLYLQDDDFVPCPVCKIQGYQQFVITTVSSPYLMIFDNQYITQSAVEGARKDYILEAMNLQNSLGEIENEHRSLLMHLDSKNRENEEQLKYAQSMLLNDLHSLRGEIETGKQQILKEQSRLKVLRDKSEAQLKEDLGSLQAQYSKELDYIYRDQKNKSDFEKEVHQESLELIEFEKNVALMLIDVLYSSQGRVIYTEVPQTEQKFLENLVKERDPNYGSSNISYLIRKVYQIAHPDLYAENKLLPHQKFMFLNTNINEGRKILTELSSSHTSNVYHQINRAVKGEGAQLIYVGRVVDESLEGSLEENDGEYLELLDDEYGGISWDYVMIILHTSYQKEEYFKNPVDNRLLSLLEVSPDIPTGNFEKLKTLEKEAYQRHDEHIRRLWGELDPSALDKVKEQDEEINSLHSIIESLRAQINTERQTQESILKELRINLTETPMPQDFIKKLP